MRTIQRKDVYYYFIEYVPCVVTHFNQCNDIHFNSTQCGRAGPFSPSRQLRGFSSAAASASAAARVHPQALHPVTCALRPSHAPRTPPHHGGGAARARGLPAPLEERGGERHERCSDYLQHTHRHLHIYMPCPFSHACHVLVMPDLQGSISRIHRTIELMYSDKTMMQVRFKRKINKVLDYNN